MPRPWTEQAPVRELLASCAEHPPLRDNRTGSFNRPTPMFRRDDERLAALRLFHQAAEPPLDSPGWKAWALLDEQVAVARAIEQFRTRRAA